MERDELSFPPPVRTAPFSVLCSRRECRKYAVWYARPSYRTRDGYWYLGGIKPYCHKHLPKTYADTKPKEYV